MVEVRSRIEPEDPLDPYLLAGVSVTLMALAFVAWLTSIFSLPGNWIALLLFVLFGWWEGFVAMRPWVLLLGFALCALGEALEFLSGYFGAKRFGASPWGGILAVAGAILGALLGAGFGYGLGAIPGTVVGAFVGALVAELVRQRHTGAALRAGFGAALGRAFGLASRLSCGAALLALMGFRVGWQVVGAFWGEPGPAGG